jgi:hypothetical protein
LSSPLQSRFEMKHRETNDHRRFCLPMLFICNFLKREERFLNLYVVFTFSTSPLLLHLPTFSLHPPRPLLAYSRFFAHQSRRGRIFREGSCLQWWKESIGEQGQGQKFPQEIILETKLFGV